MKNRNLFLLCTLLSLSNVAFSQANSLFTNIIKKTESAVFLVYGLDNSKKIVSQGSGFFISASGIGITNFHVLKGCNFALIKTNDGKEFNIQNILDYNNSFDLIKFKISNPTNAPFNSLNLTKSMPATGENILNISNPLGLEQTVSTGIVSSIRELSPYGNLIQITAPISEGSSGSPIINIRSEVVGVATMGYKRGQNLNFAVSFERIRQLNKNLSISVSDMAKDPLETSLINEAREAYFESNYPKCLQLLISELTSNPLNHFALNLIGQINLDQENFERAIEYFFKAFKQDTINSEYVNSFGVANAKYCYLNKCDYESFETAYNAYSMAIELNPTKEIYYFNRAMLICNYLKNVNKVDSRLDASAIYEALKDVNYIIEFNPFFAQAYYLRSMIKFQLNDNWSALSDADKSIDLDNANFEYYFNRGEIKSLGLKDYKNGLVDLNKAYTLTDDNKKRADIRGSSSISKYMLGDKNGACNDAKEAYSLDNSSSYRELVSKFCN